MKGEAVLSQRWLPEELLKQADRVIADSELDGLIVPAGQVWVLTADPVTIRGDVVLYGKLYARTVIMAKLKAGEAKP